MKNFYMSITDYSEIRFLTGDITDREDPDTMLAEKGIITAKGNPSKDKMRKITEQTAEPLIVKVHSGLKFRKNTDKPVIHTFNKMYDNSDYTGMYLYLTFLYGFVGWKTPLEINLISSRRDLLAAFFGEFMEMLDNKLREWSAEDEAEDESEKTE